MRKNISSLSMVTGIIVLMGASSALGESFKREVAAAGVFTFNELGQVVNFETERYMEKDGTFELKPWSTPIEEYGEMNGMLIPSNGKAVWHLEDGEFPYWRGEIFDLDEMLCGCYYVRR